VDLTKVTNGMGTINVAATGHRFRQLKQKYDINLTTKTGSRIITARQNADVAADGNTNDDQTDSQEAAVTPVKAKKAAPRRPRKGAKANQGPVSAVSATPPTPTAAVQPNLSVVIGPVADLKETAVAKQDPAVDDMDKMSVTVKQDPDEHYLDEMSDETPIMVKKAKESVKGSRKTIKKEAKN
jgi:hypothetical protein